MNPYTYINSFVKFGKKGGYKPGLKRINALLESFGHPENKLNIIHVAGSNGKGSTIAYLKSIYQEAGYKVGVYTSPHLIEFNERIEINGKRIREEELRDLVEELQPIVDNIRETYLGEPSFFEIVTTLAFLFFYRQKVDILLLEVGLGGRLDATNVITSPLISVITSISLEHTSILGDTVEEIAREKSGIIKNGVPVVVGVMDEKALKEIKIIAEEKDSKFINVFKYFDYIVKESSLEGQKFSLVHRQEDYEGRLDKGLKDYQDKYPKDNNIGDYIEPNDHFIITMLGEYQIRNAILAMTIVEQLNYKFEIEKDILKEGLIKAYISGRMEIVKREPLFIVDGAHNADGIAMFVSFIKDLKEKTIANKGKVYIILAVLADKELNSILREISNLDNIDLIISENESERALKAALLKSQADSLGIESIVITPLSLALKKLENELGSDDIVFVVGSLYNIAQVKRELQM